MPNKIDTNAINNNTSTITIASNNDDKSWSLRNKEANKNTVNPDSNSDTYRNAIHGANMFTSSEIRNSMYSKTYRFGLMNPYDSISTTREYLFFTKPDLHIIKMNDTTGTIDDINTLNDGLDAIPYWQELMVTDQGRNIIRSLQSSYEPSDNFSHILQNMVSSNLDVPGLSSEMIDTPTNMFGTGYRYRGSSEASDDNPEFSLEFKDTRWLDIYTYFKTYEEYETLKHHGIIRPWKGYIENKILHDQFSIYKFLVSEDAETILYYGKMVGVVPKSLPRDVFSNPTFDNGISYTVDFQAAFYEDMKPEILQDFNSLNRSLFESQPYNIDPYNIPFDRVDTRPAKAAYVTVESSNISPTGYLYKLKWKGSDSF